MKIAIVTYALHVGGMETVLFELAHALRNRGHEISFVITENIGSWHNEPLKSGFEVISVIPSDCISRNMHARNVAVQLSKFDICLLNHAKFAQAALGLIDESTHSIAVLHNLHHLIFEVGLSNFENLDAVIALGSAIHEKAMSYNIPNLPIHYIANGIKLPAPIDRAPHKLGAPLKIVFLGRIEHKQKGVFYLDQIAALLFEKRINFELHIVGDGIDNNALISKISCNPAKHNIFLYGAISREQSMSILEHSDVLLMPSHFEGQPLALIEAMVRGVIPVVSRLPGIAETIIHDNTNGILVDIGDVNGFVNALESLANNIDCIEKLSVQAKNQARVKFDSATMADNYISLIEHVINKKRNPSGRLYTRILGPASWAPEIVRKNLSKIKSRILK